MRAVWFFGPSAVGKKTLLFQLADVGNRRHELAVELGLGKHDLVLPVVIPNHIRGKRGDEYERMLDARIETFSQIYRSQIQAICLMHGQGIDVSADIPGRLKDTFGCDLPLAVYLHIDKQTYEERATSRGITKSYERAYASADSEISYLKSRFSTVRVWQRTLDSAPPQQIGRS